MRKNDHVADTQLWGRRLGFGKHPALLVIDLTRAFTEVDRPLGSAMPETIENANALLDIAHGSQIPVIFTVVSYDGNSLQDAGMWAHKVGGLNDLRADGIGVQIDPRLDRKPNDDLLLKKYASCFFGTDLVSRLNAVGCDTLIIVGCSTSGCVRATAVDAIQYGFRPIVVEDAVADRWAAAHRQALADLQAKYADVLPLQAVAAHLESRGETANSEDCSSGKG